MFLLSDTFYISFVVNLFQTIFDAHNEVASQGQCRVSYETMMHTAHISNVTALWGSTISYLFWFDNNIFLKRLVCFRHLAQWIRNNYLNGGYFSDLHSQQLTKSTSTSSPLLMSMDNSMNLVTIWHRLPWMRFYDCVVDSEMTIYVFLRWENERACEAWIH